MTNYPNISAGVSGYLSYIEIVHEIISANSAGRGEAIMTTIDANGRPHATWMATVVTSSLHSVKALTSSNSRKAINISSNLHTEWMFSDAQKQHVVYLRGKAVPFEDPEKIAKTIEGMDTLNRSYFLKHQHRKLDFVGIETTVEEVEFNSPKDNIFVVFQTSELHGHVSRLEAKSKRKAPISPTFNRPE